MFKFWRQSIGILATYRIDFTLKQNVTRSTENFVRSTYILVDTPMPIGLQKRAQTDSFTRLLLCDLVWTMTLFIASRRLPCDRHKIPVVIHVDCPQMPMETDVGELEEQQICYAVGCYDNVGFWRADGALAAFLRDGSALAGLEGDVAVSIDQFVPFAIDIDAAQKAYQAFFRLWSC